MALDFIEHLEILYNLSSFLKVRKYLEIGVREGASLLCVLCQEPEITTFVRETISDHRTILTDEIIGRVKKAFTLKPHIQSIFMFDTWYYRENKTGEHINRLLQNAFKERTLFDAHIYPGDSKKTVPRFLEAFPDEILDLVLVDGDHNAVGVTADLNNLVGRFKVMVAHDVFNPEYPHMPQILKTYAKNHNYLLSFCGHRTFGTAILFNLEVDQNGK